MVPGFQQYVYSSELRPGDLDPRVALAGPWDFDDGSGRRTKICGQAYSKTLCTAPVLLCKNCRQCHWSDSYGTFEDCTWYYPCGGCLSTEGW